MMIQPSKYHFPHLASLFLGCLLGFQLVGQNKVDPVHFRAEDFEFDEIRALINDVRIPDSSRALLCYEMAAKYYIIDMDSVLAYARKGLDLSKSSGYKLGLARNYTIYAPLFAHVSMYDSLTHYIRKAEEINVHLNDQETAANIICNYGGLYQLTGELDKSIEYYLQFLQMADEGGNRLGLARGHLWVAQVFHSSGLYDRSLEYHNEARKLATELNDSTLLSMNYNFMAYSYEAMGFPDSAYLVREKADEVRPSIQKTFNVYKEFDRAGEFWSLGNLDSASHYFQRGLDEAQRSGSLFGVIESLGNLARVHQDLGAERMAKTYWDQFANYQKRHTYASNKYLPDWAELEKSLGNEALAYDIMNEYVEERQKIISQDIADRISELEMKYQVAIREGQLKDQALTLNQRKLQRDYLIGAIAAISFLAFFLLYRQRIRNTLDRQNLKLAEHKADLQLQKIKELEVEKKLVSVQSMIKGQEEERSRLAKELHDGLGSALSSIKLSVSNLRKQTEMLKDHQTIDRTSDLVDKASLELRRIAQDLMPATLMRFGLVSALEDFIGELNYHTEVSIDFQHFDVSHNLSNELNLTLYRIIQELVNNALRHSESGEILVQLIEHDDRISLTVEDDGEGFDPGQIVNGRGLVNIQNRLDFFGGEMRIESKKGEGTSVHIECPLYEVEKESSID